MFREVLVDEEVNALWRVLQDGQMRPTSFIWRDKTRYVDQVGRSWEERTGGKSLRCFLIQAVNGETYELRWDAAANVWTLYRAWLRAAVV